MERVWTIPAAAFDAMAAAAKRDYPEETCGMVFGDDSALEVVGLENVQNRLHEDDPQRHPRDARTAYQFDALEFDRVLRAHETSASPLRAIYHSHPDHDAYFSAKDRQDAAPEGWGPLFPEAVYIVLSVRDGALADTRGYGWCEEAGEFVEVTIRRRE